MVLLQMPPAAAQRQAMLRHIDREIKSTTAEKIVDNGPPPPSPPPPQTSALTHSKELEPAGESCPAMLKYFTDLDRKIESKTRCSQREREYVLKWFMQFGPAFDVVNLSNMTTGTGSGHMRSSVFELAWVKYVQIHMQRVTRQEAEQFGQTLDYNGLKDMLYPDRFYGCKWTMTELELAEVCVYQRVLDYKSYAERTDSSRSDSRYGDQDIDRLLLSDAANVFYWHRLRIQLLKMYPERSALNLATPEDCVKLKEFLAKTLHAPTSGGFEQSGRERIIQDHMPIGSFSRYKRGNTIYGDHFSILDVMQSQLNLDNLRRINSQSQCSVFARDFKREKNRQQEEAKRRNIVEQMKRARRVMAQRTAGASSSSSSSKDAGELAEEDLATTAAASTESTDNARVQMDASTDDTWMLHAFHSWWNANCHYDFYATHCLLWSDWGGQRKELQELADESNKRLPMLVCLGDNVWFVHYKKSLFFYLVPGTRLVISALALWLRIVVTDFGGCHKGGKKIPNIGLLLNIK